MVRINKRGIICENWLMVALWVFLCVCKPHWAWLQYLSVIFGLFFFSLKVVVMWAIGGCTLCTVYASVPRPALVGSTWECRLLAPVELKGFVPTKAAFKNAKQHYLPRQMKWARWFTFIDWRCQQEGNCIKKTQASVQFFLCFRKLKT